MTDRKFAPVWATLFIFLMLYGAGAYHYAGFRDLLVLSNLLTDNAFLIVAGIGMTFVILSGGIDMSVGAMIALVGVLMGTMLNDYGYHPLTAIAIALLFSMIAGTFVGILVAVFGLQPFVVTLVAMFLYRGIAYLINLNSVPVSHPFLTMLSDIYFPLPGRGGVSIIVLVTGLLLVLGVVLAHQTRFGMNVYAVGGDRKVAYLMGLPVIPTVIYVYALSGLFSGIAGVIFTLYTGAAYPLAAIGVELDVITAVVMGGAMLTGGVGLVVGTFLGCLVLGIIQTLIAFDGTLNSGWTKVAIAGFLLLFLLLQKGSVRFLVRGYPDQAD
ncbi:ABC transporter permease subunit [Hahella ganghwensis]|uniref:ABC transporter permease subunit n=1 Tax=Hahella ganghwensis TaxID=286420 RepID=UPI00036ACF0B|nr:hypothetical protein [Hahella ganghwensis]